MSGVTSKNTGLRLFLWGELNEDVSITIIDELLSYTGKKPVTLYINSNGGNIADAIAIIQAMRAVPYEVNTCVLGNAFSAAMLVAAAGTGCRSAGPLSRLMFHPIHADLGSNNVSQAIITAKEMNCTWNTITGILEAVTDGSINEDNISMFENDYYMSAAEARKLGLIDQITTQTK